MIDEASLHMRRSDAARVSEQGESLGQNLRARRRELKLTLQMVADRAGLTAGFISQIERDITTPSLSSLVSVARVLDTHVSDFLAQPAGDNAVTRHNERPVYSVGNDIMSYERISSNFAGNALRSVIVHEPPGRKKEPIRHDGEEIIFVLDGAVTAEIEGAQTILETGDSVHIQSTKTHCTWNHTDRTATILWAGTMDIFGDGNSDPDPIHRDLAPESAIENERPHHQNLIGRKDK
jgi:transcriptional regulator with XRE-family HTH domain